MVQSLWENDYYADGNKLGSQQFLLLLTFGGAAKLFATAMIKLALKLSRVLLNF